MCNANPNLRSTHWVPWLATVLMALSLLLSGCFDGTTGDRGPAGEDGDEGPAGPAGPSGVNLSTLGVTVVDAGVTANPGRPWVDIEVTALSQFGTPVVLRPDDFGVDFFEFGFSRLVNRGGYESWQPYVASASSTHADSGIDPAIQVIRASALRGHDGGEWEHQGGGVWRFYLDIDVNDVPAPYTAGNVFFNEDTPVTPADWAAYTGNETHRVSVLLRPSTGNWEPTHDFMDFVPNGGVPVDKHVVANTSCNNCHDLLGGQVSQNSIHGRTRTGAEHCTACHNQYHIGTRTVEPVDLAYIGHQIHSGGGIANSATHLRYDWSTTEATAFATAAQSATRYMAYYPGDIKNCSTCHDAAVASGADLIYARPTMEACGSCHNNVDFVTGEISNKPSTHPAGVTNAGCAGCHQPGAFKDAEVAHLDAGREFARAGDLRYVINSMERDGDTLTVEWQVLYNGTPIESGADGWTVGATLLVGWGDEDYFHSSGVSDPDRPGSARSVGIADATFADGVYTSVVNLSGENHAGAEMYVASLGGSVNGGGLTNLVASNAVSYLGSARRQVATMAACTTCHEDRYGVFNKHGANRHNDVERCIICHNNNSTDIQRRSRDGQAPGPDGLDETATNFMVMAHAIHGQGFREEMISIAAYGLSSYNTKDARRYPGRLANCNQCHTGTTYYGMGPRGTTFDSSTGMDVNDVDGHIKTTAAMAACSSCHDSTGAKAHMKLMGGQDEWDQATIDASAFETCGTCHGAGRAADVRVVHGLN